jgi:HD-GYP domain-containing protein (c-di-GMP phosphodiesterase class II)
VKRVRRDRQRRPRIAGLRTGRQVADKRAGSGEDIPLASRIIGLCAAFVGMTNALPERPARTIDQAFEELRRSVGTEFDSAVVEALVAAYDDHSARLAVA